MEKRDIPFLSATELSDLIAGKEISPVEATEAYLERIEQVDKQLNSYITVTADGALRSAREAERAIAQGHYRGPMHGVPVAIKDQIFTKGVRTTGGSRILADFVPEEDATVAAKLNQAGAVLLGKLNMSEFAMAEIYDHPHGTPRNPWDPARNPGTSSSGSGAATAAFLCATSLGEDTGGSIRSPANWCGLVGLRPTWGRVSRYGVMGAVWSMDTAGPISRTVEDCALTLQTIAGHDPKDPFTQNVPVPDYRRSLSGDMRGLKVGVLKERMETGLLDPEYREAVLKATAVLGELGGVVEEVSIPLTDHSGAISWGIIATEWSAFDVLVLPTGTIPAAPVESEQGFKTGERAMAAPLGRMSTTGPFNLAGVPAVSVPCGFTSIGLPLGLQIAGRPFAEETVLKVAHAYEQATPWHSRRPPI